jgi:ribosomal protein L40E
VNTADEFIPTITLEQLLRLYTDILLIAGDEAFQLELMYYNSVREAARRGVPGAQAAFRALQLFFRRGRRTDMEEPTETQLLRDARALLHGKKDGKIVIEGQAKHTAAASHAAIDDTFKPHGAFKEVIAGTVCERCHAENPAGHKFCHNCGGALTAASESGSGGVSGTLKATT